MMQPGQRQFSIRYAVVTVVLLLIEAYLFAARPETLAYSDFVKLVKAGHRGGSDGVCTV